MTISAVSNTNRATSTQAAGGDFRSTRQNAMNAVANKLGMSADDLKTALQSGKSLADVATSKGVSTDDLISTIKQSMTANGTQLSDSQATQVAARIANHKGGHHHHHGGGTPQATAATTGTTGVSPATGSTTGQLLSQLA